MGLILVVDADCASARSRAEALTAAGFSVHCERAGRSAIAVARKVKFRGVIVELALPDVRGDEVCDELRSIDRAVPIFLCSSIETRSIAQWAKLANATVLRKPIDESQLVAILKAALPSSR